MELWESLFLTFSLPLSSSSFWKTEWNEKERITSCLTVKCINFVWIYSWFEAWNIPFKPCNENVRCVEGWRNWKKGGGQGQEAESLECPTGREEVELREKMKRRERIKLMSWEERCFLEWIMRSTGAPSYSSSSSSHSLTITIHGNISWLTFFLRKMEHGNRDGIPGESLGCPSISFPFQVIDKVFTNYFTLSPLSLFTLDFILFFIILLILPLHVMFSPPSSSPLLIVTRSERKRLLSVTMITWSFLSLSLSLHNPLLVDPFHSSFL